MFFLIGGGISLQSLMNCEVIIKVIALGLMVIMGHAKVAIMKPPW